MDQDIHEHPNPAYLSVRKSYLLVLGDALESLESAVEYGEPRSLEELSACRALRDAVAPLAARRARAQRIAALEAELAELRADD